MYILHLAIFVFVLSIQSGFLVTGILCYECRSASDSSLCISNGGMPIDCNKNYCTIYRQEYLDPAGTIQHFYRSCEDAPTYLNAVIQTPNYLSYYRACNSDICNSGDGIKEFTVELRNSSSTTIYLVPGVGSADGTALCLDRLIVTLISLALLLTSRIIQ